MKNPTHLYHYTSIETLALILKHKTIRFNSLIKVNDLEEAKTNDYGDLGRFCFVSCWTDVSQESIPLWKMYTPNMNGVRIKLPIYPFKKYKISKGLFNFTEDVESYIDLYKQYKNNNYVINPPYKNFLLKLEYTDDIKRILPTIGSKRITGNTRETSLNIEPIGKYKRKNWNFENEWRYKIFICPWKLSEMKNATIKKHQEFFERFKTFSLPFDTYDLELDAKKIEDIEILIGPKTTEAEKIIIQSLIQQYNPNAIIKESSLSVQ